MGDNWQRRERENRMSRTEGTWISVQNACRRCGQDGHYARNCRAPQILFCWVCGRPEIRTIACCRLPRRRQSRARGRERSRSSSSTDTNRTELMLKRIFANIIIGGEEVAATIDTGATSSFIRDSFARKLGSRATYVSYKGDVILADGSTRLLDYAVETQVEFGNCSGIFKFIIMPGVMEEDIVLGLDFLTKTGATISLGGDTLKLNEFSPVTSEEVEIDVEVTSSPQTTEDEYEPLENRDHLAGLDLSYLNSPDDCKEAQIDLEATASAHLDYPEATSEATPLAQTIKDEPRESLDLDYTEACENVEIDVEATPPSQTIEDEPRENLDRLAGLDLSHLDSATIAELRVVVNALDLKGRFGVLRTIKDQKFRILVSRARVVAVKLQKPSAQTINDEPEASKKIEINAEATLLVQTIKDEPRESLDLDYPVASEKVEIDAEATPSPQTTEVDPCENLDRLAGLDLSHLDSDTIAELREVVNALDLKGRFSVIRNVKEKKFRILVRRSRVIAVTLRNPTLAKDEV